MIEFQARFARSRSLATVACRPIQVQRKGDSVIDRPKLLLIGGWTITIAVVLFMLRDVSPDLQQEPWAIRANAGLGIPSNMVLPIGITGLICTLIYALPQTAMLGAILLTGFVGGAAVIHLRLNGDFFDIGENILIGVLAWTGLWLRDSRVRRLLPIRRD